MTEMRQETTEQIDSLLSRCESRLERLLVRISDDTISLDVAESLRDLASLRMAFDEPRAGDKRLNMRFNESALVTIETGNGTEVMAALHDISTGGALIEVDAVLRRGDSVKVKLPGLIDAVNAQVLSTDNGLTRLSFSSLAPADIIELVKHMERHFTRY